MVSGGVGKGARPYTPEAQVGGAGRAGGRAGGMARHLLCGARARGAGHFVQEDCPETLVALIQAFIQTTGGGNGVAGQLKGGPSWRTRL